MKNLHCSTTNELSSTAKRIEQSGGFSSDRHRHGPSVSLIGMLNPTMQRQICTAYLVIIFCRRMASSGSCKTEKCRKIWHTQKKTQLFINYT
jgi:hypothetical protein